ncbi:major tail protein [Levilactobacillus humaensis]|uniref:major tail protein n=1 Tax=Levilactobacillus humaensis TaxID=2950375 RepID=UPI0021C2C3BF|nr:major tail protein [Levilactobacillus humaensis]
MTDTKNDTVKLVTGVSDAFLVMKTASETSNSAPTYDTQVWRLPTLKKVGFKGNGKSVDIYGSSKKFATISQETGVEVSVSHLGFPIELLDLMRGEVAKNGVTFTTTTPKSLPEFAFGFIGNKQDGEHDGIWLPSVTLDPAMNEEWETGEDEFKEADLDMTLNAAGLRNSQVYATKYSSMRESAADFSIENFFKQVIFDEESLAAAVSAATTPASEG